VNVLVVARWTVLEARRRKLLLAGAVLSVAFIVLFAVGFTLLYHNQEQGLLNSSAAAAGQGIAGGMIGVREQLVIASTVMLVLGLYGVQFLASLLSLFLGVASVSPEVDSGALHAVLARPLSRLDYLLGRFLALVGLMTAYVVVMSGSLLLTARIVAGYTPGAISRTIGLMTLQVLILLAVSLLGSTVLPTLANGIVMLALFGVSWLAGIVEFVGTVPPGNDLMVNLGTAVSLLLPSDAVWRGASYHALPDSLLVASSFAGQGQLGLPFASTTPLAPLMLAWALVYPIACIGLALASFRRRDL
jgi:Cu-processing system permease protein